MTFRHLIVSLFLSLFIITPASAVVTYDSDASSTFKLLDAGGMEVRISEGTEMPTMTVSGTGVASIDADTSTAGTPPAPGPGLIMPLGTPFMIYSAVSGSAAPSQGFSESMVLNGWFIELKNSTGVDAKAVFEFSYSWLATVTRTDPASETGFASPFFHLTGFAPSGDETLEIDSGLGFLPVADWLVHPAEGLPLGSGGLSVTSSDTGSVLARVTVPGEVDPGGSPLPHLDTFSVITDSSGGASVPEPTTLALMGLGLAGIGYRRHRSMKAILHS